MFLLRVIIKRALGSCEKCEECREVLGQQWAEIVIIITNRLFF